MENIDPFYEKIIPLAFGSILTLGAGLIIRWINDVIPQQRELRLLISELDDMRRHCKTNLNIIKDIDLSKGIPSVMHFEKMKIPESSILFSAETYRRVHYKHSMLTHEIKLVVRNINIELTQLINYIGRDDCNKEIAGEYVIYLKQKMGYVINRLKAEMNQFADKTGLEPDPSLEDTVTVRPDKPSAIVYDRQFTMKADKSSESA